MPTPNKSNEPRTVVTNSVPRNVPTWVFISRHQPALFLNGETIPLSGDREYVIGRDPEECNIVINDARVSRKHAAIHCANGRFFITDFDSMNGTLVNKERITTPMGLLPGDEIRISTQKFLFVLHDQILSASTGPAAQKQSHFSGLLRALRIPDLVQLLNGTQQTGRLTIEEAGGGKALVYFVAGEIVSASYRGKADEEAVYALMMIQDGQFDFVNETPTAAATMHTRTMPLLLEACRRADEAKSDGKVEPKPEAKPDSKPDSKGVLETRSLAERNLARV